jgi:hypothetical protein
MWRCGDNKCEDVKIINVKMWGCENNKCEDVRMRRCGADN